MSKKVTEIELNDNDMEYIIANKEIIDKVYFANAMKYVSPDILISLSEMLKNYGVAVSYEQNKSCSQCQYDLILTIGKIFYNNLNFNKPKEEVQVEKPKTTKKRKENNGLQ
jgi:hypothetical protein